MRSADDFSIYAQSKSQARKIGNQVYLFLKNKPDLPINRSNSGIRRPATFKVLGYVFVPIYKKGSKGHYQLVVSKHSWQRLKCQLKELTKKTLPLGV